MSANASLALDVRHLTVGFGAVDVIRDLSFEVPRGSSLAVIGPNGAGKTVLFRALIGALPHSGTVQWAADVRLGYVPQTLDLQRDMPVSGLDFLRARLYLRGGTVSDLEPALALVGLSQKAIRTPVGALSGGQFQRLLIAFALIGRPSVLLLDEPTAGIDEPGQERLTDVIHRLETEQGLTVLLISHELSVVYRYATRVLCLGQHTTSIGPPSEVLTADALAAIYGDVALHHHDH